VCSFSRDEPPPPPTMPPPKSQFLAMKEEMESMANAQYEIDWEPSDGYSTDTFDVGSPKSSAGGTPSNKRLHRTDTAKLNEMFGGGTVFESEHRDSKETVPIEDDRKLLEEIDRELTAGLKNLSKEQKESFKQSVAENHKDIEKASLERTNTRLKRRKSMEEDAAGSRLQVEIEKKKINEKKTAREYSADLSNRATPGRPPTCPVPDEPPRSSKAANIVDRVNGLLEGPPGSATITKTRSAPTAPPPIGSEDYDVKMSEWELEHSLRRLGAPSIESLTRGIPNPAATMEGGGKTKVAPATPLPSRNASINMSFGLNPDYVGRPVPKRAKMKRLRKQQASLSHRIHEAFRFNDLATADKLVKRLNKINNTLIELSGKKAEVLTNIKLAEISTTDGDPGGRRDTSTRGKMKKLISSKPKVPLLAPRWKAPSMPPPPPQAYSWYENAKAKSPLFKRRRPQTAPQTRPPLSPLLRASDPEWISAMQEESWGIVEKLRGELKESRLNKGGNVDIIGGAQYKRLLKNYEHSYEAVKGALDLYFEKEAARANVPATVVSEAEALIRKSAREFGIDWKKTMNENRRDRPQSANNFTTKRLHRSNSSFNKTKRTKRGARPKTASVSRRRAKESGRKRRPQSAAAHLASTSNSSYILKNGAFLSSRSGISSLQDSSVMGRKELASTIPLPRPKSAVSRPRRRKVSGRPQSASVQRAARNGGRQ
jgi:hypothetical protein